MATVSTIAQPASASSLRRLIIRHPVAAYLMMAFSFAWGAMLPLLFSRQGFGVIQVDLPVKPFISLASFVGLALPAFVVTAAIGGKAGVMELMSRCLRWRY